MSFAPICVPCRREMRCRKNDYVFLEYGAAAVWAGDLYQCEKCEREIVTGVAREPVIESFEPGFDAARIECRFRLVRDP